MTKDESPMTKGRNNDDFDLEERSARFGESVIDLVRPIISSALTGPLVSQLVRAASSVGANYCEANDSCTRKEFRHRIGVCRREARESKHWLRMIARAVPDKAEECRPLWQEAKELNLIFSKIIRRLDEK
jgi:four helix bundle protein